jgi:hypothetical protein
MYGVGRFAETHINYKSLKNGLESDILFFLEQ